MKKSTVIISIVSALVLFGFLYISYTLTNKPEQADFPSITKVLASDHTKWSTANKNVLVEYGDFQCPACKGFYDYLKSYEASGSADADIVKSVTFVYRHYPIAQIHPNAYPTSYAAEAAAKQGKFWEMYDLLYTNHDEWAELPNVADYLLGLAKELGLNIDKFKADMASPEVKNKVEADMRSGGNAGLEGTPSFYFNGKKLKPQSFDELADLLRSGTK